MLENVAILKWKHIGWEKYWTCNVLQQAGQLQKSAEPFPILTALMDWSGHFLPNHYLISSQKGIPLQEKKRFRHHCQLIDDASQNRAWGKHGTLLILRKIDQQMHTFNVLVSIIITPSFSTHVAAVGLPVLEIDLCAKEVHKFPKSWVTWLVRIWGQTETRTIMQT